MAKLVNEGDKVAVIGGIAGDVTSDNRVTGFTEGLATRPSACNRVARTGTGRWH